MDTSPTWEILLAAIPGVLIALLTHWLDIRRQNQLMRQESQNGRKLLGLEITSNRAALTAFWQQINDLDKDKTAKETKSHVAAMAEGGLLSYALPQWNFTRWHHSQPDWLATLSGKEVEQIDGFYRDLQLIADLHARLITLTPQEQTYLEMGSNARFWTLRYGEMRDVLFDRLTKVVNRAVAAASSFQL
jgi:hypothetical protein